MTKDEAQAEFEHTMRAMKPIHDAEEAAVRYLGDKIGYGRLMQLAEQVWHKVAIAKNTTGSEHTIGPCAAFMVRCPHLDDEWDGWRDKNGHCDWCCGAGRVTERVASAMRDFRKSSDQ